MSRRFLRVLSQLLLPVTVSNDSCQYASLLHRFCSPHASPASCGNRCPVDTPKCPHTRLIQPKGDTQSSESARPRCHQKGFQNYLWRPGPTDLIHIYGCRQPGNRVHTKSCEGTSQEFQAGWRKPCHPAGYLFVTLLRCRPNCGCAERRNGERRLFFHENVSRRHTLGPEKVLGGSSGKDLEGKKGSLPTRRTEEKSSKFIAVIRSPLLVTRLLLDLTHRFKRSFL